MAKQTIKKTTTRRVRKTGNGYKTCPKCKGSGRVKA
jgi:hypothetical protein